MADVIDLPARHSPFASLFTETPSDAPAGITIAARTLDQVQVDCDPARAGGIALPLPAAGRAQSHADMRLLNLAPGRWMVVARGAPDLAVRVAGLCGETGAAVVEQGHGRATLRLSGPAVRDVLAKGTGVDLHPRTLAVDSVVSTALFHVAVTIDRRRRPSIFDIHMPRGYARSLAERLIDAGRQYGVRIEGQGQT